MAQITTGAVCVDSKGKSYNIGKRLGGGGEGDVYEVNSGTVAKIYDPAKKYTQVCTPQFMEEKLKLMLKYPVKNPYDNSGKLLIAWPSELLYHNGSFCGYLMPKINVKYKLFSVYRESAREVMFKPNKYDWSYALRVAINLAIGVGRVHEAGHLVGDMNPSNFFVDSDGSVILIDTDSFDISDPVSGKNYKCMVGYPDYIAPELQGRRLDQPSAKFTRESDNYSLAINLFRILMEGNHPFNCAAVQGAVSSSGESKEVQAMQNGDCPYIKLTQAGAIPALAPDFKMIPNEIRTLFVKAFDYTQATIMTARKNRPTAAEWANTLVKFYDGDLLTRCAEDSSHIFFKQYAADYGACPWCERENRMYNIMKKINTTTAIAPVKTTPQTKTIAPTYNANSYGNTYNQNTTYGGFNAAKTYRSAGMLYAVLIIAGIASGFFIGGPFLNILNGIEWSEMNSITSNIDSILVQIILAVIGGVIGGFIAKWCSDSYRKSYRVWPWYLLAAAMPIATFIAGAIVTLAIVIVICIIYLALVLLGLALVCACCGNS